MDMKYTPLFGEVPYKCKAITTKGRNYSNKKSKSLKKSIPMSKSTYSSEPPNE